MTREVPETVKLLLTQEGWVIDPDDDRWSSPSEWKDREQGKICAFMLGEGWKTRKVLERREVPALGQDYTLDELNAFQVRYGHEATRGVLRRVYPGAEICMGSEMGIAESLHRPAGPELKKFQEIFGIRWRDCLSGMAKMFGTPLFDLVAFDKWCQDKQGYVEDGKTSLGDFIRMKWGNEVHDWFVDVILNSDPKEESAKA